MKNILILLIAVCTSVQCTAQQGIDEQYVSKILNTLSDDKMQGRHSFTKGGEMAADFLSAEFESLGLKKLPELGSYKQEFAMYEITLDNASVTIDGQKITKDNIVAISKQKTLNINSLYKVKIINADKNTRLPDAYRLASKAESDVLVLIDPMHSEMFRRYKNYLSQPVSKLDLGKGNNIVFAMTDVVSPKSINIEVQSKIKKNKTANVVAMIEGKRKDEIVMFSGHYDHLGVLEAVKGDSIANGANDDASGITAVMTLAKYFKGKPKPERTLYFVAFTAEELGLYGSQYFCQKLDPERVVAMFNIEMIGKPAVKGPNSAWISGFDKSNFGKLLQKSVEGTQFEFYADPYPGFNLFYRSDNATLARLGVPAHTISTTPIDVDKDYHQVTDEVSTLNIPHMTNTIKAIAKAAEGMVSAVQTPTRVDKSTVD